MSSNIYVI